MLKGIPQILSPELVKILMEMGHGDEIVLADANFPSVSCARRLVRCDGLKITELLPAILQLFPLDRFVKSPVKLMSVAPGDAYATPIWDEYTAIIRKYETQQADIDFLERFEFYKAAGSAYVVVATGEKQLYANIILKKGVIEG